MLEKLRSPALRCRVPIHCWLPRPIHCSPLHPIGFATRRPALGTESLEVAMQRSEVVTKYLGYGFGWFPRCCLLLGQVPNRLLGCPNRWLPRFPPSYSGSDRYPSRRCCPPPVPTCPPRVGSSKTTTRVAWAIPRLRYKDSTRLDVRIGNSRENMTIP